MEIMRFLVVSVCGIVVDIAIAYAIATMLGAPLWIAAAAGFSITACGNYVLHEVWTFRHDTSRLSPQRALYYFFASIAALTSRLVFVSELSTRVSHDHTIAILIGGAAVSFVVNYTISKLLVFSRHSKHNGSSR